ncbi:glycosyltransferase [Sphingomonas sp. ASV193]|uniref:glycosyltransferase n=1 Tax=Sphingomonas sp. ASV193 TaxID=3144405 RepID=UPI0032E8FAC1
MTRRLLFVAPVSGAVGGREQLSALHEAALRDLVGDGLRVERLERRPPSGVRATLDALRGRIDGIDAASETRIAALAREVDTVWLDGTNLGRLAAAIKRVSPSTRVVSFAHNVERRFFTDALRRAPGARALAVLAANIAAERTAVRHSDTLVAINRRDSGKFERLYGRAAEAVLPMAIADGYAPDAKPAGHDYLLFVGGGFYANRAGIAWFADKVAPRAALRTMVVGRGLGDLSALDSERLTIVGAVDDLSGWYAGATAVVAPIFDGSGMKTKVAEALMHGKRVIGTAEAFTGYESLGEPCCETADDFVAAIAAVAAAPPPPFDPALRARWESDYSPAALRQRLRIILQS